MNPDGLKETKRDLNLGDLKLQESDSHDDRFGLTMDSLSIRNNRSDSILELNGTKQLLDEVKMSEEKDQKLEGS